MKKFLLSLVVLSQFTLSQAAYADGNPQFPTLGEWANYLKAQGEFAKLLSEAQLNYAKAQLVQALAAQEMEKARQLHLLVNRLELQLRRLARDEAIIRRKIETIQKRSITANVIMSGNVTPASLTALAFLQIQVIPADVTAKAMLIPIEEDLKGDLIPNGTKEAPSFDGRNVGQLLTFLRKNNLTVEPWGLAHQKIVEAYTQMAEEALVRIEVYREEMKKIAEASDPFQLTVPFPPGQFPSL